jgi:ATP-dependent 26S proteasome regulatory subunit
MNDTMKKRIKHKDKIKGHIKKQRSSKKPQTIVQHIQDISDASEDIGSLEKLLLKTTESISVVAEYLKCSDVQAAIFSMIFSMNFVRRNVDLEDLAALMKCNPLNIGTRIHDFDELINMRLIRKEPIEESRRDKLFPQAWKYHIIPELFEPILKGANIASKEIRVNNLFAFLECIYEIMNDHQNGTYSFEEMELEIHSMMNENEHLPFVSQIKTFDLNYESIYILLYICHSFIQNEETVDLSDMIKCIYPTLEKQISIRKAIIQNKHELQKKELLTITESFFRSDRDVALTEKCVDLLFSDDKMILTRKEEKKKPGVINFHDIPEKKLFFGEREMKSIGFLEELLRQDNYKNLILRLEEKKMSKGIAILLYGAPGTGKTESVYQIARRTGRDIHQVIISETKSMWFGESEKLIKRIFDKYRNLVELKEIVPVLLFNEVDGIFGRRKESNKSSIDQTENAIQNIILQEMEDLNGILIATTNMVNNLDKAFERRFLYKICFEKPSVEARVQIWKDKIPSLSVEETVRLAEQFKLSGGQIDNIARKCLMKEVLQGTSPNLDELFAYCNEENLQTSVQRIGFRQ